MRSLRHLSLAVLSGVLIAACATSSPGWTYAPAPSMTPIPSASESGAPSGPPASGNPNLVQLSAFQIQWEQTTLTAPADTPFQVQFENKDPGTPHDISLRQGSAQGAELFKAPAFNGVETRVFDVPALDAGAYAYVCTIHPTMIGTLNVQ